MLAEKTLAAIDDFIESNQEDGNRNHLGASLIGRPCSLQLWFIFRWAKKPRHRAQLLRLFNRGHLEEDRFVKYLRDAGMRVWDVDAQGQQFRIIDCDGHFGGSSDGVAMEVPDVPVGEACLTEYKTKGDKPFKKLVTEGIVGSNYEHFVQMQVYMDKMNLNYGLYMCVNKNNDELHMEIIKRDPRVAEQHILKADNIIHSNERPAQISNTATYYQCKFCDFTNICHGKEIPQINCRTCAHSTPGPNGTWDCARGHSLINEKELNCVGCCEHVFNPHMLNNVELVSGNMDENYLVLQPKHGKQFKHGPDYITSQQIKQYGIHGITAKALAQTSEH